MNYECPLNVEERMILSLYIVITRLSKWKKEIFLINKQSLRTNFWSSDKDNIFHVRYRRFEI